MYRVIMHGITVAHFYTKGNAQSYIDILGAWKYCTIEWDAKLKELYK